MEKHPRPEGSGGCGVQLFAKPADVVQVAGGGRAGGLYLDRDHRPVAPFEDQVDLSFLVVPVVEHTQTATRGGQLAGDLVDRESFQQRTGGTGCGRGEHLGSDAEQIGRQAGVGQMELGAPHGSGREVA